MREIKEIEKAQKKLKKFKSIFYITEVKKHNSLFIYIPAFLADRIKITKGDNIAVYIKKVRK